MVRETHRKSDPTRTPGATSMAGTSILDRYSRQTLFGPIGKDGQTRLGESAVAIIGCGALGTVIANNLYSAVIASYGVTMNIIPGVTPCLRCIFPEMPLPGTTPTCDTAGVLNGIVGAIVGVATTEALKLLLQSDKVSREMFWMDVWENTS